jgi:hypothetical protein
LHDPDSVGELLWAGICRRERIEYALTLPMSVVCKAAHRSFWNALASPISRVVRWVVSLAVSHDVSLHTRGAILGAAIMADTSVLAPSPEHVWWLPQEADHRRFKRKE